MTRLTKRVVEAIKAQPEGDTVKWDSELPGFGIRVWPSGKRTYILKYRTAEGRQRKATIGPHGPITAERARSIALRWLGDARHGSDPAKAKSDSRNALTVIGLAKR